MTKLFIDILADKSYMEMSPEDLRKQAYGARYYNYQGTETDTHGLSLGEFNSRRAEMMVLIEQAERAPGPALTPMEERMAQLRRERQIRRAGGTSRVCVRCGQPATMAASLGASCPDCYDDLSN